MDQEASQDGEMVVHMASGASTDAAAHMQSMTFLLLHDVKRSVPIVLCRVFTSVLGGFWCNRFERCDTNDFCLIKLHYASASAKPPKSDEHSLNNSRKP